MSEVMPHPYRPGEFMVQSQSSGEGTGNGSDMKRVFDSRADMIVARSEEDLRLMFQSPERGGVDNSCRIPVIGTAYITFPFTLSSGEHFLTQMIDVPVWHGNLPT